MRFKLDENLPVTAAILLTELGHDAMTVIDQSLSGVADRNLLDICDHEARALITLDLDFSDIRTYPPHEHAGIVVLRPRSQDKDHLLKMLQRITPFFESEILKGRLWIIDDQKMRIRGGS